MPEALLFQTGYLTIRRIEQRGGEIYYRLGDAAKYRGRGEAIYPNWGGVQSRDAQRGRLCRWNGREFLTSRYPFNSSITAFVIRLASLISSSFFVDRYSVKVLAILCPFPFAFLLHIAIKSTNCVRNAFAIL